MCVTIAGVLEVFSPPANLAPELVAFFHERTCHELTEVKERRPELSKYVGVYALYYLGDYPLYHPLREVNGGECRVPVYVGKAVSPGRRTGIKTTASNSLYKRLWEHLKSVRAASNLDENDFLYKVIAMDTDLVSWGEATLIGELEPVWNQLVSGFGNHDPGKGRYEQARSIWDQLHSGRGFAVKMENLALYDEKRLNGQIRDLCERAREKLEADLKKAKESDESS